MTNREIVWLLVLAATALLVRACFLPGVKVVQPDEAYYILQAQDLAKGLPFNAPLGLTNSGERGQPLLPYLFAAACRTGLNPVKACQWISILLGVLTLLPLHLCARSLGGVRAALWTDCLYTLAPFTIQYSLLAMYHSVFNLALVLVLFCALKTQASQKIPWAAVCGLSSALAYMVRPEAFAWVFYLALGAVFLPWLDPGAAKDKRLRVVCIFIAAFALAALPFWIWVRIKTGSWSLIFSDGRGASGVILWHWNRDLPGVSLEGLRGALHLVMLYLKRLNTAYSMLPRILPLLLWVFVGFGITGLPSGNPSKTKGVLMALYFAVFPLVFYPLVVVVPRNLYPSILFFLPFAGAGIGRLQDFLAARLKGRLAIGICLALVVPGFFPGYGALAIGFAEEPLEERRLGEWIQEHCSGGKVILASDIRTCFYAGPDMCKKFIPMLSAGKLLQDGMSWKDFLRKQHIDLVAADTRYIPKYFPAFQFLLQTTTPEGLKELVRMKEGSDEITLYQVQVD